MRDDKCLPHLHTHNVQHNTTQPSGKYIPNIRNKYLMNLLVNITYGKIIFNIERITFLTATGLDPRTT